MVRPAPLRPELASVLRYVARPPAREAAREQPRRGVLAELRTGRGLQ